MAQKQGRDGHGQLSVEDFGAGAEPSPTPRSPSHRVSPIQPVQAPAQVPAPAPAALPIHWPTLAENLRHFHDGIMGLVVDARFEGKVRVLAAKAARAVGRLLEPVYEEVVRGVRREVEGKGHGAE